VKRVQRIASTPKLVLSRLRSEATLTAGIIVAMAALISVWVGIPLYAESASARLLGEEVASAADDDVPFGYLFSYNRLSGGNTSWSDLLPVNDLVDGADTPFGSTVRTSRRVATSVGFDLVVGEANAITVIDNVSFVSMTGFEQTATIAQGRTAQPSASSDEPVEVVVDVEYAAANGLTVGDRLGVVNRRIAVEDPNRFIDIQITGLWTPPDTTADVSESVATSSAPQAADSRFLRNGTLVGNLVVPESTMSSVVDSLSESAFTNAQWLVLLDSAAVTTDSVSSLLARTERINREVDDRLRGARLLVSPQNSLAEFQEDVAALNRGLSLFSLPTLALGMAVLGLLISMRWNRRLGEVSLLRRRGVSAGQIIFETSAESILIAAIAGVLGGFGARSVASLMGTSATFLRFDSGIDLELLMNSRSWSALALATTIACVALIAPSLFAFSNRLLGSSTRRTATTGWWKRGYLDLAVVAAIAFFSWFLLRRDVLRDDILDDPIVILLPAITAFGVGVVMLRLFPWLMRLLAQILERTASTSGLLVTRRSARVTSAMSAPLLLLVITAALAIYTGSLARTLDLQLYDSAYHLVGASNSVASSNDTASQFEVTDGSVRSVDLRRPAPEPASFNRVWGIDQASRVARLAARLEHNDGTRTPVSVTGIDTTTFADIAFWRDDYSTRPLRDLVARLAATPDSLLVNSQVLRSADLAVGDVVTLTIRDSGQSLAVPMVIVGSFDQFPTWGPGDELTPVLTSLAALETRMGQSLAQEIFYDTDESTGDPAQTRADLSRLGISTAAPERPELLVERQQQRPERQGIFGLLTVSFLLSTTLTVIGFTFYALFGFTRQVSDIGVLRALGMPLRSLRTLVALDLLLVASLGVGVGAATGVAMATWYLPRLIDNPLGGAPALLEEVDWTTALLIPVLLAGALVIITIGLLVTLRRIKLFAAVKLGGQP